MGPRVSVIGLLAAVATITAFAVPPFTRPASYYAFVDRREVLGVPNGVDVLSGAPWAVVGLLGLWFVARTRDGGPGSPFPGAMERTQFAVLFAALLSIAAGSAYFHLAPTPATMLWDRLPISIAFMALFAIVIGERIGLRAGRALFVPLLVLGISSVVYWHRTELAGRGDERLYALVQFFPMLALPLLLLLFPATFTGTRDLLWALGWYALAKLFELADRLVFAWTGGAISGHTLKHLAGAVAAVWLLRLMTRRRPVGAPDGVAALPLRSHPATSA